MNLLCLQAPPQLDRRHSGAWLDAAIASIKPQHDLVEIDLSATEKIDARGVASLLTLNRCFSTPGMRIRLVNPSVPVVQLLELMGMHRVFQFASRSLAGNTGKERPILVIEDELIIRSIVHMILKPLGLPVLMAENGLEGLHTANLEHPSLIVLDYLMPLMNGAETLRRLKASEATHDIPVIVISSDAEVAAGDFQRFPGADLCLSKPFSPNEMRRAAARLIQGRTEALPAA